MLELKSVVLASTNSDSYLFNSLSDGNFFELAKNSKDLLCWADELNSWSHKFTNFWVTSFFTEGNTSRWLIQASALVFICSSAGKETGIYFKQY